MEILLRFPDPKVALAISVSGLTGPAIAMGVRSGDNEQVGGANPDDGPIFCG
jgi:hypothetical protein